MSLLKFINFSLDNFLKSKVFDFTIFKPIAFTFETDKREINLSKNKNDIWEMKAPFFWNLDQKALDELKDRETQVEKEIQNLNLESEKRIAELKNISTSKLTDQIEKRKILAENKIEQLVRDTNNSIKNYISSVAIEVTRNILLQNLSKDKKSALIEESITEFNSVLKN